MRVLFYATNTKAARGYVGAGPRYPVLAARGEFASFFREQRRVLGGSGSVIESDGLENLRAALIFSQHQAVLLRWDFSIFQGSRVSAHGDYYSVVIIFSCAFFRVFLFFHKRFSQITCLNDEAPENVCTV